ncbi:MAG: hypothetical protein JWQ11_2901 [Rhizobacter sp.]|nr:hypothetical protein [Rhizobacter sp.]
MATEMDDLPKSHGVIKPVGHVLASFPTENDARSAMNALASAGFGSDKVSFFSAEEVVQQAERDIADAGILASLGQELNLVKAHRDLAAQGHCFISVYAPDDDDARKVADIAAGFKAERAQQYGHLIIEELIEPGDGEKQVFESPDKGLDSQTTSGYENDVPSDSKKM